MISSGQTGSNSDIGAVDLIYTLVFTKLSAPEAFLSLTSPVLLSQKHVNDKCAGQVLRGIEDPTS